MKNTYNLLFALLRKEICGEIFSADIQNVTAEQYLNLYRISKSHDIAHIVGDALYLLNVGLETEIKSKFQKAQMMAMYRCAQMNYELQQLCTVFEKAKISFMPLKGSIIRKYYAKPEMRTSCDIDIYVKESDLENATSVLISELGYKLGQKNIYDVSFYANTGVHIELHFALTEHDKKVDKVLETIWDTATKADETEYHYIMSNEMFLLYHIAHVAKHFVYGGCGIRPFMDLWVAKNKMGYDLVKVKKLLQECGLGVFGEAVLLLSDVWFSNAQHTEVTKEMELYIVGAGSYGTMENKVAISQAKKGGRIKYALGRIFQSYPMLKIYYPRLEKYPILFPYYQVKRWCRILFTKDKKRAFAELKYNSSVSEEKKKRLATLCNDLELL